MRHRMRWALPLAGLVWLAPLAACAPASPEVKPSGSSPAAASASPAASPATATPSASLLPSPSADPIRTALTATAARGTAAVLLELLTAADGVERTLIGEGVVDFSRGASDLRWSADQGDSREVRTEDGFFVEVEPGQWLAVDPQRPTPTSDSGLVLRGLADIRELRTEGSEPVDGQPATRIQGWLPAAGNIDGLGLTDAERVVVDGRPQARIAVTVWVDEAGRIVQVLRTLEQADSVAATSMVQLREFGAAAPISPPSSIAATAQ